MTASPREPQLRPASPDDAPALVLLSRQLGYPEAETGMDARLEAILASDDDAIFVLSHPRDGLMGWIHVFVALRVESPRFAEIGGLVVGESNRRQGFGARLLAAAGAWARARGVKTLRVRSRLGRLEAKSFYLDAGFVETKQQRVLDKPLT